jgi:uncharacterized protein YdaU (DUF1376 family)
MFPPKGGFNVEWYPHKIDAYDGKTRTLTLAEDGAYCRLLRWYYKHEEPLPDDDEELAAICRCSVDEWRAVAPKVKRYFVTRDAPSDYVLSPKVLVHAVCKDIIFAQNKRRKDWKSRQEKLRKNNGLENVTRDAPVGHDGVTRLEERRGEEKEKKEGGAAPADAVAGEPAKASSSRPGRDYTEHPNFAEFYLAYPRKRDRLAASKAFDRVMRRGVPIETLLASVRAYAAEVVGSEPKFIQHPATFLNAGGWMNEYTAPSTRPARFVP